MPAHQINLLQKEDFEKRPLGKFLNWALTVGRWIVVFTELVVILAFLSRFKLDTDLADLQDKIREKQSIVVNSASFEKTFRSAQNRIIQIQSVENNQLGVNKILEEFQRITPSDLIIKSLNFKEKVLTVTGTSFNESGLSLFINNLSGSPIFTQTQITNITKGGKKPGLDFTIKTELK